MEIVTADEAEAKAILRAQELDRDEPLLQENTRRFVMFPIKHPDIWQFYKKAEGTINSRATRGRTGPGVSMARMEARLQSLLAVSC